MTNSIGYANPAAISFGTIALEKLRNTPQERHKATDLVKSRLPANHATEVLEALGLLPPPSGRE